MGVLDVFNRLASSRSPLIFSPRITPTSSWDEWSDLITERVDNATPAKLYREQPHLRTVVSFLARNAAQLSLHVFERVGENDRRRDRTSPLARVLQRPNAEMTAYDLMFSLVGDKSLYDQAWWYVVPSVDTQSGWLVRRLPPSWVSPGKSSAFAVQTWVVTFGDQQVEIPAADVLYFPGYMPSDPIRGSAPVESLRNTLREQIEAAQYRRQIWKRGGRVSSVLERPKDAPKWTDNARNAFRDDWYAKFTGNGAKAGGTPILEDGMTLKRVDFSATEQQFVEAAKLSMVTVASAYHVNPTMVGQNEGANYSNVREFRKALYTETLGPLIAEVEDRINTFLLPMLGMDPDRFYAEFNIQEKLQGSFEEQAAVMSSAVGRPWMTADEARGRFNMPALGGDADRLVTPLNVLVGGQASPRDSGSQNRNALEPATKAAPLQSQVDKGVELLSGFFKRQGAAVLSVLGAKADRPWWDQRRWDAELSAILLAYGSSLTLDAAKRTLDQAGIDPSQFDEARVAHYLVAKADGAAADINATTKAQIEDALAASGDPGDVFDAARTVRAHIEAAALATAIAGFATVEAGKQTGAKTKTWVTGPNPRPEHAAMNGKTVPIDENFPTGTKWPAGPNCNCTVTIGYADQEG